MEHGAQTHTLPALRPKLEMVARRCGYGQSNNPAGDFIHDLENHTAAVRAVYDRVFIHDATSLNKQEVIRDRSHADEIDDETVRLIKHAAARLEKVIGTSVAEAKGGGLRDETLERVLSSALPLAINATRSLRNLAAWAESLSTYTNEQIRSGWAVGEKDWIPLIERLVLVLSSHYLAHLLVSRPLLAGVLVERRTATTSTDFIRVLRDAVNRETDGASKTDALRRAWYRLVVEIGYRDMAAAGGPLVGNEERPHRTMDRDPRTRDHRLGTTDPGLRNSDHLRAINLAQTALAEAALQIASEIALEALNVTSVRPSQLPFTILALGRLGHAGMDYGSDLDLLVVFDDDRDWPPRVPAGPAERIQVNWNTPHEFYSKLTAHIVRVLSSITREGLLYRSDLRLRPEGKSGPVALSLSGLIAYIENRASAWEHSAYLKAREVAGDLHFGERVRTAICEASFDAASRNESLREELRDMRARQVKEKLRGSRPNIKWGRGGMSDVYFVTRYLQLRDRIWFPPERGTSALIGHLGELGALDSQSEGALFEGYTFLRRLDHWMRLLLERPNPTLPASSVALRDIVRALSLPSIEEFERLFAHHTAEIRDVFDRVFGEEDDHRPRTESAG
jgi:glutamate-ammonia-ligase adenylyltransferase